jgi:hypothetical protein
MKEAERPAGRLAGLSLFTRRIKDIRDSKDNRDMKDTRDPAEAGI